MEFDSAFVERVLFGCRRGSGLKKAWDEDLLCVTEFRDKATGTEAEAISGVALVCAYLVWPEDSAEEVEAQRLGNEMVTSGDFSVDVALVGYPTWDAIGRITLS